MISKYGMIGCKPILVPLEPNAKLSVDTSELLEDLAMYRCIVGSLIYTSITRLDLRCYAMGLVSQFMQALRKPHLDTARQILRHVNSMLHYTIFYEVGRSIEIYGYTNID